MALQPLSSPKHTKPAGYFSAEADSKAAESLHLFPSAGRTHISLLIVCWWRLQKLMKINFPKVLEFLVPDLWRVNSNTLKSLFLLNEFYVK